MAITVHGNSTDTSDVPYCSLSPSSSIIDHHSSITIHRSPNRSPSPSSYSVSSIIGHHSLIILSRIESVFWILALECRRIPSYMLWPPYRTYGGKDSAAQVSYSISTFTRLIRLVEAVAVKHPEHSVPRGSRHSKHSKHSKHSRHSKQCHDDQRKDFQNEQTKYCILFNVKSKKKNNVL